METATAPPIRMPGTGLPIGYLVCECQCDGVGISGNIALTAAGARAPCQAASPLRTSDSTSVRSRVPIETCSFDIALSSISACASRRALGAGVRRSPPLRRKKYNQHAPGCSKYGQSRRCQVQPIVTLRSTLTYFLVSLAWIATSASAQGPTYPYVDFGGRCQDAAIRLELRGDDDGAHEEVVGFDIYRRALGACGEGAIRINDTPIPRQPGTSFTLEYTDRSISSDVLYHYQIFGVDAERSTLTSLYDLYGFWVIKDATYTACGRPVAAHGTLSDIGWAWSLQPCPNSCFPGAFVEPWFTALEQYLGTSTPLLLYGSFGMSVEGWMLVVNDFEVADCATAVTRSTWSGLKRLFK